MELKFGQRPIKTKLSEVLIVPLWNWNNSTALYEEKSEGVLIVPLWNWNKQEKDGRLQQYGFNRTFMELK